MSSVLRMLVLRSILLLLLVVIGRVDAAGWETWGAGVTRDARVEQPFASDAQFQGYDPYAVPLDGYGLDERARGYPDQFAPNASQYGVGSYQTLGGSAEDVYDVEDIAGQVQLGEDVEEDAVEMPKERGVSKKTSTIASLAWRLMLIGVLTIAAAILGNVFGALLLLVSVVTMAYSVYHILREVNSDASADSAAPS